MLYYTASQIERLNEERAHMANQMMMLGLITGIVLGMGYCVFVPTLPTVLRYAGYKMAFYKPAVPPTPCGPAAN
ncbi:MAG: hypothetical protein GC134_06100 [Proteobacteria bacterium]|nr:hypothetical protein [Pseudomonadota bacterium]